MTGLRRRSHTVRSATGASSVRSNNTGIPFVRRASSSEIADPGAHICPKDGTGDERSADDHERERSRSARVPTPLGSGLTATIQPGKTLILTQTGGKSPCGRLSGAYNFEPPRATSTKACSNDNLIPVISLSINGTPVTVTDAGQVLNTGGSDEGVGSGPNEAEGWVAVT